MQEKIWFENSKGEKLAGLLSNPDKKTDKIVVMCHGLNSDKNSQTNIELEKVFLKNNIATFRFDFYSHGESEGEKEKRSVKEFVDNILQAIKQAQNKKYKKIALYGASFGGVAAVIAATYTNISVLALKAAGMGQTSRNTDNYKSDFEKRSWILAGNKIKIPTLIIHGTEDIDVEVELGKALSQTIKNSKLSLFEGADHRFTNKQDFEKMIKEISSFILGHLNV